MSLPQALDVSKLPKSAMDHRSLIWWGNLLMMIIETMVFALVVASYLYIRMNFVHWPPPQTNRRELILAPFGTLTWSSVTLGLLLLSLGPMIVADRAALKMKERSVIWALIFAIVLGLLAGLVRWKEMTAFPFNWDENAYTSVVWILAGMHLMHIVVGTMENVTMVAWLCCHPLDKKHARDIRVDATYWYWVVGIWIPLYLLIYIGPRIP